MVDYNKFPKQGRRVSTRGPRDQQRRGELAGAAVDSSVVDALRDEIKYLRAELTNKPAVSGKMFSAEEVDARLNNAVVDSVNEVKTHYERQMKDLRETLQADTDTKQLKKNNSKLKNLVEDIRREKQFSEEKLKLIDHTLKQRESELNDKNKEIERLQNEISKLYTQNEKLENSNTDLNGNIGELKEMLTKTNSRMEMLMAAAHEGEDIIDPNRPKMEEIFIDPSNEGGTFETHLDVEDTVESYEKETLDDKVDKLKSLFGNRIPGR